MRKIIFIFTIISLFSFKKDNTKIETGFTQTCLKLVDRFRKSEHGYLVYNKTNQSYIKSKDFANIILDLIKFDFNEKKAFKVEKITSIKLEKLIWKKSDNSKKLEKKTFKSNYYEKQSLVITDYTINQNELPHYIRLRMIENEFEELIIDKITYNSSYFESRLIGADEAIREFEKFGK